MDKLLLALVAIVSVPALTVAYIVATERILKLAPRHTDALRPWLWIAPATALVALFLVFPALNTVYLSFLNHDSKAFVGLDNYWFIFTQDVMLVALRNNLVWMVVFTAVCVALGLLTATLVDRVPYEPAAKAVIFLPMAISFVAAGVIWRFMYDFRPPGTPQTGTLNALLTWGVPGFEPQAWLTNAPLNNVMLIVVAVWVWTGFSMVILSAAIKGIPPDVIEAARVDGAGELTIFFRITLPLISPTIAVVATTLVIFALKAFDIVYVMTNGNFDTEVIANRMYKELFNFREFGRASAIATVLLLATIPVVLINLRRFKFQEEMR